MESGGNAWDIVIFGIYSYLIYDVIAHWSDYEDCHSPIQVFLLLTYCSILVHRIIIGLKSRPNLPWLIKKCVNITFYWIMNPLFIYITVQGIIWQVQNNTYTPSCIPESRVPWMIWWWVAILVLVDLLLIMITVVKLISWWRRFIFRRRVHRLMSGSGDLNQLLNNISHGSMNAALNDEVGLELTDLERIPKERFLKSLTNIFQQDSCPICYEDYQNDATIITLPGCEHVFHPHCINNWLLRNPLCPICRSNVRNNLVASMNKEDSQTETTIDVSL